MIWIQINCMLYIHQNIAETRVDVCASYFSVVLIKCMTKTIYRIMVLLEIIIISDKNLNGWEE